LKRPTAIAAKPATLAEILAGSARVAPMRLAIRVEAAIEMGKGIWKVNDVMVERTDLTRFLESAILKDKMNRTDTKTE